MTALSSNNNSFRYPLPVQQFIHGQWVDAKGSEVLRLVSSVDDSVVVENFRQADENDVNEAVVSAEKGLIQWQALSNVRPYMYRRCPSQVS